MMATEVDSLAESIKQRTDIIEVIGEHIELGRDNKAVCPFHDDHKPSFSVNSEGQYFYCFGCGAGGDVIRFIELYEHLSFIDALEFLAHRVGLRLPSTDPAQVARVARTKEIENILAQSVAFYCRNIPDEARAYIIESRKISPEMIIQFQIGYAAGGLKAHLLDECGYPLERCLEAGVLKKGPDGTVGDYFHKRIIFPNILRGRVVHLTGRNLDGSDPKYLHLAGKRKHLFNEGALSREEVILTEGVVDCLMAEQVGYPTAALLGTSFKPELVARFRRCKRVYLCLDGDNAGRSATQRICRAIPDQAIIVTLPENADLADYLAAHTPEDFRQLLDRGTPFLDNEIARLESLPESKLLDELQVFLPLLASLSDFRLSHYADVMKRKLKVNKSTILKGVQAAADAEDQVSAAENTESAFTPDERHEGIELLEDPNLMERFSNLTVRLGCVGEENNKVMLLLALTSRIQEDPISLYIKGDSSGGKSFLVETVSRFIPSDEVHTFTSMTRQALYYRTDDLSHKVLIIYEREGAEESDYTIRSLQSEKKLSISVPVKDPKTGRFETIDREIKGPVAVIETTTRSHLHPENETRCFTLYIDDSEEQTKRIHQAQMAKYSGCKRPDETELRIWQAAQKELKPYPVIIPYLRHLTFPTEPLRMRRDFQRFLTLLATSALLHQRQRQTTARDGIQYLVADVEDYATAYVLGSCALGRAIKQLSPKAEELLIKIESCVEGDSEKLFTRRAIRELLGWEHKTVVKYVKECVDLGALEIAEGGDGRAYKYRFVKSPDETDGLLLHPDKLRQLTEEELSNLSKPIPNGFGQVNILDDNELSQPIQAIQGRTDTGSENAAADGEEDQFDFPFSGGQVGQVDSTDCNADD